MLCNSSDHLSISGTKVYQIGDMMRKHRERVGKHHLILHQPCRIWCPDNAAVGHVLVVVCRVLPVPRSFPEAEATM